MELFHQKLMEVISDIRLLAIKKMCYLDTYILSVQIHNRDASFKSRLVQTNLHLTIKEVFMQFKNIL